MLVSNYLVVVMLRLVFIAAGLQLLSRLYSPPQFAQRLAELCVVQVGILVRQLPPRRLRPNHERVHWPFHMRFVLRPSLPLTRHGHQRPVVTFQHLRHRVTDAGGEPLVLWAALRFARNPQRARCLVRVKPSRRRRALRVRSVLWNGDVAACWTARMIT